MTTSTTARRLLLLSAVACVAAAQDGSAHHIRLGLESLPRDHEIETRRTVGSTEVSTTSDGKWDEAGRLTLGYQWTVDRVAPVSFILGAGLAFSSLTKEEGSTETTFSETGIYIEPGVAWHVGSNFDLEFGLRLGAGAADPEAKSGNTTVEYDTAGYGEAGLHARGIYHFDAGFELGAELSLFGQTMTIESESASDVESDVSTSGAAFGLVAGWRF